MTDSTTQPSCFALVDCNSFYASCERIFRPDLNGKPIVVLSNNDGCIIARSAEAKRLNIPMGQPYFRIKNRLLKERVNVFSANFVLYGDISERVMTLLESRAPEVEIYSIDEAFLNLTGISSARDLTDFATEIKTQLLQQTGMPVCIGIGPTKTLAKLANHVAKKQPSLNGVGDLRSHQLRQQVLKLTPVADIWGIGRRLARRLEALNINTAKDLAQYPESLLRKKFGVVVTRTQQELLGYPCLELAPDTPSKQQILFTRTFGQRITEYEDMHAAIVYFTEKAAEKLRRQQLLCQSLSITIRTNPKATDEIPYKQNAFHSLNNPTDDSRLLIHTATELLKRIWRPGHRYMRGGVLLSDISSRTCYQPGLLQQGDSQSRDNADELMHIIDQVNQKTNSKLKFAGQLRSDKWQMNQRLLSPRYTTRWQDLPITKCK